MKLKPYHIRVPVRDRHVIHVHALAPRHRHSARDQTPHPAHPPHNKKNSTLKKANTQRTNDVHRERRGASTSSGPSHGLTRARCLAPLVTCVPYEVGHSLAPARRQAPPKQAWPSLAPAPEFPQQPLGCSPQSAPVPAGSLSWRRRSCCHPCACLRMPPAPAVRRVPPGCVPWPRSCARACRVAPPAALWRPC